MAYTENSNRRAASGLLMTHSTSVPHFSLTSFNIRDFIVRARTAGNSRMISNNIFSNTEEIRPIIEFDHIEPNRPTATFVNVQRSPAQVQTALTSDSYVINLDLHTPDNIVHNDQTTHNHPLRHTTSSQHILNHIRTTSNEIAADSQNSNNRSDYSQAGALDPLHANAEVLPLLQALKTYAPFVLILLTKIVYDHRVGILNFLVLSLTFNHANRNLKREIAKKQNRSWITLLVIMCYISACIVFINFSFETHIFSPYTQPLSMRELLWSVTVTDFVLKLITIVLKVALTCLPVRVLGFQKRGKYYVMVEATSQLYRCIAPIQPWLYYLHEVYQGPEKILGVFLSAGYAVTKINNLLSHLKLFCTATWKLLQNVNLGVSPSKEQLIESGGICAICHDEYLMPVRLHCNHIFCETCMSTWLDRERTCPLCRATITDDPIYRDGHTTQFIQLF